MKNTITEIGKDKYSQLSKLGSTLNLSFSSQVLLGDTIIALDGVKRKLLVTYINDIVGQPCIIDLDEVETISVKKNYNSIKPGELKKRDVDEFLQTILLRFECSDEEKSTDVIFYAHKENRFYELAMRERNARNWQLILSKMLMPKKKETPEDKKNVLVSA